MKVLKEKLKNSYISILDYFNEAFKLFWYLNKKREKMDIINLCYFNDFCNVGK